MGKDNQIFYLKVLFREFLRWMVLGGVLFYFVGMGTGTSHALSPKSGLFRGNVSGGAPSREEMKREASELFDRRDDRAISLWIKRSHQHRQIVVELISRQLSDPISDKRWRALYRIREILGLGSELAGEDLLGKVSEHLTDGMQDVEDEAFYAMISLGKVNLELGQKALDKFVPLLQRDTWMALDAIWYILMANSRLSQRGLLEKILPSLEDGRYRVRKITLRVVSTMVRYNLDLKPIVKEYLVSRLRIDQPFDVREGMKNLLRSLGYEVDEESTRPEPQWGFEESLAKLVEDPDQAIQRIVLLLREEREQNQSKLMKKVVEHLKTTPRQSSTMRQGLVEVLGTVEGNAGFISEILDVLEPTVEDPEEAFLVLREATRALGYLGQVRSKEPLERVISRVEMILRNRKDLPDEERARLRGLRSAARAAIHKIELAQELEIMRTPTGRGGGMILPTLLFRPTFDGSEGTGGPWRGPVSGGAPSREEEALRREVGKIQNREYHNPLDVARDIGKIVRRKPSLAQTALELVRPLFEHTSSSVKIVAFFTYGEIVRANPESAERAIRLAASLVNHANEAVAKRAVNAIGEIVEANPGVAQSALMSVIPLFEHRSGDIKATSLNIVVKVVWADPSLAQRELLDKVVSLLQDQDELVRMNAANAISDIVRRKPQLLEHGLQPLLNRFSQETDPFVREDMEGALEYMGYLKKVTPTLSTPGWNFDEALEKLHRGNEEDQHQATQRMVQLLQQEPGRKQEVMALVSNAERPEQIRWRLAVALGTVQNDNEVMNLLEARAADSKEKLSIRQAAVESLGYLGQERSRQVLEQVVLEAERTLSRDRDQSGWLRLKRLANSAIRLIELVPVPEIGRAPSGGGGGRGPSRMVFRPILDGSEGTGGPWRGSTRNMVPGLAEAIESQRERLKNHDVNVRLGAIRWLKDIISSYPGVAEKAAGLATLVLRDKDPEIRRLAILTIKNSVISNRALAREKILGQIKPLLKDRRSFVRMVTLDAVREIAVANPELVDQELLKLIRIRLNDRAWYVGQAARDLLKVVIQVDTTIGEEIWRLVLSELESENEAVRLSTVYAIKSILRENTQFLARGREILNRRLDQERVPEIREAIQTTLELLDYLDNISVTVSTPSLNFDEALEKIRHGSKEEAYQVTQGIVRLLHEESAPREEVMRLLRDQNELEGLRWRLAVVLGTLQGDSEVLDLLENLAWDSQEILSVRQAAVESLGYLAQSRSKQVLGRIVVEAEEVLRQDPKNVGWMRLKRLAKSAVKMIQQTHEEEIRRAQTGGGLIPPTIHFRPTLDGTEGTGGPWRGPVSGGAPSEEEEARQLRQEAETIWRGENGIQRFIEWIQENPRRAEAALDVLLPHLKDDDSDVRRQAAESIWELLRIFPNLASEALFRLISAHLSQEENPEVRDELQWVAEELRELLEIPGPFLVAPSLSIGEERLIAAIGGLRDPNWHVREAAVEIMMTIVTETPGLLEQALRQIESLFQDQNRDIRISSIDAMRGIVSVNSAIAEQAVERMIPLLRDGDPDVRESAVFAIRASIHRNEAVAEEELFDQVTTLLQDQDRDVRLAVVRTMESIARANPQLVQKAIERLLSHLQQETDTEVRKEIHRVLEEGLGYSHLSQSLNSFIEVSL